VNEASSTTVPSERERDPPRAHTAAAPQPLALRFGSFELDLRTSELRRAGLPVRLQHQPARVLARLALRAGELVSRDELRRELWGEDTFVDFEQGLNFCVRRVRAALCDEADRPRFIETLPRRGYRFVAAVEPVYPLPPVPSVAVTAAAPVLAPVHAAEAPRTGPARRPLVLAAALLAAAVVTVAFVAPRRRPAGAALPDKVMLVVLPFDNLSGDPQQEYVGDGLTEELITQLASVQPARLGVIARTSAMSYKGRNIDLGRLGRELGVDYVVEGSLRRGDGRVRVTAQLIQVSDQTHVWATSYDTRDSDALGVQSDVATRIAAALVPRLLPDLPPPAPAPGTANQGAYDAYLRGRHLGGRGRPELLRASREALERAVALDPRFAAAHAALAETLLALAANLVELPLEVVPAAKAAAERALALDPSLAEAHVSLGVVKGYFEWDLPAGYAEFQRALQLNPGLAAAHHAVGDYYSILGRHDEAVATVRRAIVLDPVSATVGQDLGWYLYLARRHDEAADAFRRALEYDPGDGAARAGLSLALWYGGREADAVRERLALLRASGRAPAERLRAIEALAPRAALRRLLSDALERQRTPWAGYMLQAMLAERDATLDAIEQAADARERYIQVFAAHDPRLDFVRSEPRFQALQRRLGLAAP
jgi:TolB-like protein/DNA-binding winged helix-turn-helix (wHTH) protein/lipoprotein NlpI